MVIRSNKVILIASTRCLLFSTHLNCLNNVEIIQMSNKTICFMKKISEKKYRIRIIKGYIFLKNRHFIIQERFTKLIYGINKIIKCGT